MGIVGLETACQVVSDLVGQVVGQSGSQGGGGRVVVRLGATDQPGTGTLVKRFGILCEHQLGPAVDDHRVGRQSDPAMPRQHPEGRVSGQDRGRLVAGCQIEGMPKKRLCTGGQHADCLLPAEEEPGGQLGGARCLVVKGTGAAERGRGRLGQSDPCSQPGHHLEHRRRSRHAATPPRKRWISC